MKKTLILSILLLTAGVAFQGCIWSDHPAVNFGGAITCEDETGCGGYEPGSTLLNRYAAVTGPIVGEGGYMISGQAMRLGEDTGGGCALWGTGGGGAGYLRMDHYTNYADALYQGCPPASVCISTYGPISGWAYCPPDDWQTWPIDRSLCNTPNGQCGLMNSPFFPQYSIDPGPGAYVYEQFALIVDKNGGSTCDFDQNAWRWLPNEECPSCSALVAPVPDDCEGLGKVLVCHIPRGNPDNAHEICISPSALPAHLAHGDNEGSCGGGPSGPGLALSYGRQYLDYGWAMTCSTANYSLMEIGKLPWTDDYNNGQPMDAFSGRPSEAAAEALVSMLNEQPLTPEGHHALALAGLRAHGRNVELSEPLNLSVRAKLLPDGTYGWSLAIHNMDLIPEVIGFLTVNGGSSGDLAPFDFVLSDGTTINGGLIQTAMNARLAFSLPDVGDLLSPLSFDEAPRLDAKTHRR